ncbi:MAG TPA: hypothetical protein VGG03_13320 [Thermoanaerobaculia bacterium]
MSVNLFVRRAVPMCILSMALLVPSVYAEPRERGAEKAMERAAERSRERGVERSSRESSREVTRERETPAKTQESKSSQAQETLDRNMANAEKARALLESEREKERQGEQTRGRLEVERGVSLGGRLNPCEVNIRIEFP